MSSAWNVQNVESEQDMNSKQIDQLRARISELEFVVSRKDEAIAERTELTKQRDLAIKALESIAGRRMFIDSLASNVDIAVMTLDVIKESEEN